MTCVCKLKVLFCMVMCGIGGLGDLGDLKCVDGQNQSIVVACVGGMFIDCTLISNIRVGLESKP